MLPPSKQRELSNLAHRELSNLAHRELSTLAHRELNTQMQSVSHTHTRCWVQVHYRTKQARVQMHRVFKYLYLKIKMCLCI